MSEKFDLTQYLNKYDRNENGRVIFSKIKPVDLPDLCAIQTESFKYFRDEGLREVFKEIFPIYSIDKKSGKENIEDKNVKLDFIDFKWLEPTRSVTECKELGLTYQASLRGTFSLQKPGQDVIVDEIFLGDYPLMTEAGSFIINGAERVVVSQIVRSPGAYISRSIDESTGSYHYEAAIIPARGTWFEFVTDKKNYAICCVDKKKKVSILSILHAFGLTNQTQIRELFGQSVLLESILNDNPDKNGSPKDIIDDAIRDIFAKLRPNEPSQRESQISNLVSRFFTHHAYDFGPAGRYKLNNKLGVYSRIINTYSAEDLVDCEDGVVYVEENEMFTKEKIEELKKIKFFERNNLFTCPINQELETTDRTYNRVNIVKVKKNTDADSPVYNVVGPDLNVDLQFLTQPDIYSLFSYFLNISNVDKDSGNDEIGEIDDIDNLGNRRIKAVGELLLNNFHTGLVKMEKSTREKMTSTPLDELNVKNIVIIKHLTKGIRDFFNTSQLSQIMDQTNPLAELTNKRRISALGPGGIQRDRASMEVRDVHFTHYGRICPIETPEGQNIGLISYLACYAEINEHGFIETKYRKVDKETHKITDVIESLSADKERGFKIAQASEPLDSEGHLINDHVIVRFNGETISVPKEEVDYLDVSPKQIVSIASACIPFLENDDIHRAMMGANMQRQALSLLKPESPYVGTGMETTIAHDSGSAVISDYDGYIKYVDSKVITVTDLDNNDHTYHLRKFERSNSGTCINQKPIVHVGDKVSKNQVIGDGPAMDNGELALGQNVLIAFMNWHGYNYEDAVIMSERLVKEDIYTSLHIEEYSIDCRKTKLGDEEFTHNVPNVSSEKLSHLDSDGVVVVGTNVKEGDILVGKVTPRAETTSNNFDKLLQAIFNDKNKQGKDASLRVNHGGNGTVIKIKELNRENNENMQNGIIKTVKVYIAQKRKISEGDKMSGRHGNKGVISRILPIQDMPFLADGTIVDIMLSPLGVPSRRKLKHTL